MKRKSGQILILVLLVVVVALAVGLSVASRNLTNLKTSTQTEQSQRAFSAAEGGVEDVLSKFGNITTAISNNSALPAGCSTIVAQQSAKCDVAVGDITSNVTITNKQIGSDTIYQLDNLDPGEVAQVSLTGYSTFPKLEFGKTGGSDVSLEVVFVCSNSGVGCVDSGFTAGDSGFRQKRYFFYSGIVNSNESGSTSCHAPGSYTGFKCDQELPPGATAPWGGIGNNVLYMRIRPFWNSTPIRIRSGISSQQLPNQIYDIEASAKTSTGATRTVKATKSVLPVLPAAFDFAIYSENAITK